MFRLLRSWLPAVLWACFIFVMSTDRFSAENTAWMLMPVLGWLFPHFAPDQFAFIHHLIRKSAHFTEYFIFCLILFRSVRGQRIGWRWGWGFAAWFVAVSYSALDEIHQAFVASRTASPYDSLLDSAGALGAFVFLALWFHFRKAPPEFPDASRPRQPVPTAPLAD